MVGRIKSLEKNLPSCIGTNLFIDSSSGSSLPKFTIDLSGYFDICFADWCRLSYFLFVLLIFLLI